MKVLFAVSNQNILTQIVKTYQKEYKEIISYKNISYFKGIVKELQKDKSYDRIVIIEDLEPYSNNNFDVIDKILFENLYNISEEAIGSNGEKIPIILLATDKRTKYDPILVKLFKIGIYNILLDQDRSTTNVCKILNKPREKENIVSCYEKNEEEILCEREYEECSNENKEAIQMQREKSRYNVLAYVTGLVVGYAIIKLLL